MHIWYLYNNSQFEFAIENVWPNFQLFYTIFLYLYIAEYRKFRTKNCLHNGFYIVKETGHLYRFLFLYKVCVMCIVHVIHAGSYFLWNTFLFIYFEKKYQDMKKLFFSYWIWVYIHKKWNEIVGTWMFYITCINSFIHGKVTFCLNFQLYLR